MPGGRGKRGPPRIGSSARRLTLGPLLGPAPAASNARAEVYLPGGDGGLVAGPIVAFRSWWIVTWSLEIRVCSLTNMIVWTPGMPQRAMCQTSNQHNGGADRPANWAKQRAPVRGCSCGNYGFRQIDAALTYEPPVQNFPNVMARAWGAVALWGRVIEHAHGWRAQWAYPLELWLEGESRRPPMPGFPRSTWIDRVLGGLGAEYGIPVLEVNNTEDVARAAARWRVGPA